MARRLGFLPAFVLIAASQGCLLYTDPINVPPQVTDIISPTPIVRGEALKFSARATDDHQDSLDFRWGVSEGPCPDANALPPDASWDVQRGPTLSTTLDTSGDYCVYVEVTDEQGAKDHLTLGFHVNDRPPTASITLLTSPGLTADPTAIPLYSDLRFIPEGSDPDPTDRDALTYSWSLTVPCDAVAMSGGCSLDELAPCGGAPNDVCLHVDKPGKYDLSLTVSDGEMSDTKTVSFTVAPDSPPCIIETDPPWALQGKIQPPTQPLSLGVRQVADDGDPYPARPGAPSRLSFVWSSRVGTAPFSRLVNRDLPQLDFQVVDLPPVGQQLQVRVEVHDRVDRAADFKTCYDAQPSVCLLPPACAVWVTWTVTIQ